MSQRKTIFISGATAGIGQATAWEFAKNDYNLILTGRRGERLANLKKELETKYGVNVLTLVMDVRNQEEVQSSIEMLPEEWTTVDILVNNAGLALGREPIQSGNLEDWENMLDTNVKGLLYLTKAILPLMLKRKKGHVINLSSIAAKEVYPNGNVYCASKHAVDALTKGMRIDLVNEGIKVTSVSPGMVDTEFSLVRYHGNKTKADETYQGFTPLYAVDVAEAIYFVASRPAHVNINDLLITCTEQATSTIVKKTST
jgi:3-hydroxy acid dehydrogenase / malonic semialdehyde reductase